MNDHILEGLLQFAWDQGRRGRSGDVPLRWAIMEALAEPLGIRPTDRLQSLAPLGPLQLGAANKHSDCV